MGVVLCQWLGKEIIQMSFVNVCLWCESFHWFQHTCQTYLVMCIFVRDRAVCAVCSYVWLTLYYCLVQAIMWPWSLYFYAASICGHYKAFVSERFVVIDWILVNAFALHSRGFFQWWKKNLNFLVPLTLQWTVIKKIGSANWIMAQF